MLSESMPTNAGRFEKIMLKAKTVAVEAARDGIRVRFEGENAPAEPKLYDMLGTGEAIRVQSRQRFGRLHELVASRR